MNSYHVYVIVPEEETPQSPYTNINLLKVYSLYIIITVIGYKFKGIPGTNNKKEVNIEKIRSR